MVADMFPRYFIVRKLPNSTSTAVCIELTMIVTELGLPHIIRSDWSMPWFQGVPAISAMLQHHAPKKQPKPSKI